jgi:hypothetical protein
MSHCGSGLLAIMFCLLLIRRCFNQLLVIGATCDLFALVYSLANQATYSHHAYTKDISVLFLTCGNFSIGIAGEKVSLIPNIQDRLTSYTIKE